MPLTITFDERALRKYLDRSAKAWPEAASHALEKVGRLAFDESQREVPVGKTKRLKSQTYLSIAPHTVVFSYTAPYARIVHFRKAKHADGKRLFVLRPQNKARRLLGAMINQFIQDAIDRTPTT